jgi:hypothetical protein
MSDGADTEERSPEGRARAEKALVVLAHQLDDESVPLIVLGGLLPEILTEGQDAVPLHLGTTDVDMVVAAHLSQGANLAALERALDEIRFQCDRAQRGWRWRGAIDGYAIKLEFLCDVETERAETLIAVEGCARLKAMNLRGTGYVARDWRWRELTAELDGVGPTTVRARFAGLEGYLLSKCVAARQRGAAKDYYDLAFVLIHNRAGGPSAAAERLRGGQLSAAIPSLRSTLLEVRARFYAPASQGPAGFASQSRLVDFNTPENELRAQAVAAVNEFVSTVLS